MKSELTHERCRASGIHVAIWDEALPAVLPAELFQPLPEHGADVVFYGRVRCFNQGRTVTALSYDAFAPLARKTLRTLAGEARDHWGADLQITVIHRTGKLGLGEAAVVVAVSASHRQAAFDACQYMIHELKHRAPIWKKEHYDDGESEWLQGHALCQHSGAHTSHAPAKSGINVEHAQI